MGLSRVDKILDTDVFEPRADLVIEAVEDEFLVLDLKTNLYFGLNELGRVIWQALGTGRNFGEVVAEVCDNFEVDEAVARVDAAEFIGDLIGRGLVSKSVG